MGGEAGRDDKAGARVKKKPAPSMMGIESPTASHLPVLEQAVRALSPDALVIEHGAGLYSTPLLARLGARVLCSEPHPGWAEWAKWIYQGGAEMADSFKQVIPRIPGSALVFIDGPARERGPILQACLDAGVPTVIAHDTQPDEWGHYGYQPHMFKHPDYAVTQNSEDTHRTTLWQRRSS